MDSGRLRESRSRAARQAAAQLEVADDRAGLRFEAGTALRVTDMEHEGGAWKQRSTNRTTTHRGKWPGFFDLLCDVDCGRALTSREAEPFGVCWMTAFDKIDGDPGVHVRRHRADREKPDYLAAPTAGRHTFFGMPTGMVAFRASRYFVRRCMPSSDANHAPSAMFVKQCESIVSICN
ncbi:hypothetical protein [Burkholderia sp. BCC1640]|uniref:hypothetical protein n=1 Tax=Burkholderia sp. BCC1640 TaxID=2676294 RepID=UPI001FC8857E|nr:hypothetical protein [Burkholderia sp. BCC1640]